MQVSIQVAEHVAREFHQRDPPSTDLKTLLRMIETFGVSLQPTHPNADDLTLQKYFTVEVPDPATAQRVIDLLQQTAAIEAAYVKPPDELP